MFSDNNDFTDDTICTIAVADALLSDKPFGEAIHAWCRRYPYPMGSYGGSFHQWVMSDQPKPYGSFGNGSAMRVSPVGWFYRDQDKQDLLAAAAASAACTHTQPSERDQGSADSCSRHLSLCESFLLSRFQSE
ncbi:MAG: ADP-ribosylglycohydrolase family protein [bacterium]|nr:ADP-ribosylglycohydrolase family protein [bacterium]